MFRSAFTAWAQRNEILATNPARRLERRKPARRGDRSIPGWRRRVRPLGHRDGAHPAPAAARPHHRPRCSSPAGALPHHSALQHLAADGRTAPELQAKSRHQHLASLGRYVRLGEQTSARVTAEADPAARRRTR